ncbi:MAG: glutaredoxin 3 [Woeseiaceae bacterium]|nr:glutaredoxin 3 [Woeseiaceae bacterium]
MADRPRVLIYSTPTCPYCGAARMLLTKKSVAFDEIPVGNDPAMRARMEELSGRRTVPQVFIDDRPIGGFDELCELDRSGKLDALLQRPGTDAP